MVTVDKVGIANRCVEQKFVETTSHEKMAKLKEILNIQNYNVDDGTSFFLFELSLLQSLLYSKRRH